MIDLPFEGRKVEGIWKKTEDGREFLRHNSVGNKMKSAQEWDIHRLQSGLYDLNQIDLIH